MVHEVEGSYQGVLIVWHSPTITKRNAPKVESTVTLVHRQFGTVWHDELGHNSHGTEPKEQGHSSTAHGSDSFFIRAYTDTEFVKERSPKEPGTHCWEFAIDGLLDKKDNEQYHDEVVAALQLK